MRKPVHPKPKFARGAPKPRRSARRRGVASILAMLFLMVTGSLAAAMAVIAQGNLRTAESSIRTTRAQGAAESGLVFAERRLAAESARFVIRRGVIDAEYAAQLWIGDLPEGVDEVEVGGPVGYDGPDEPSGLAAALRDAHLADASAFAPSSEFAGLPAIQSGGAVVAAPMRLEQGVDDHWFQLTYVPVPGTNRVRVESVGFDRGLRRTVSLEFELRKRIQYALLAPNRVMVGKNVIVEGPVGTRYGTATGELTAQNGDPLVMRSDFRYLNGTLTARIDALALAVAAHDADGDGRLRPGHPSESVGLAGLGFGDRDRDQYVDDFDAFLAQYDANSDGGVVWDPVRANAAGISGTSAEFAGVDDQLARLIDLSRPDRNEDGTVDARDVRLGYSDGVLSGLDRYAKIHGRIDFAVAENTWEGVAGQAWRAIAQGPVRPAENDAAVRFGMAPEDLRVVTTADFLDSAGWFASVARADFHAQAAAGAAAGGTITPAAGAEYEAVPFGSNAAYDYYQRPVYRDMTFTDVRIPKGLNALFVNCRFVGVTYVETEPECGHMNWNYAGALKRVTAYGGGVGYALRFATAIAQLNGQDVPDTRVHSNSIRFDGCTFLGSVAGDTPAEFMHWRNKIQFTGATRFFSDPTASSRSFPTARSSARSSRRRARRSSTGCSAARSCCRDGRSTSATSRTRSIPTPT